MEIIVGFVEREGIDYVFLLSQRPFYVQAIFSKVNIQMNGVNMRRFVAKRKCRDYNIIV
ncbi:hypothetical protein C2W64_03768 [Brevibacillus laterosporus]|nr:hypothetical protein [Brevibacillus laterosporus]RAP29419.1 hypothetical protein C2W64_03768 [Brevibacillus laterosporus]